MDRRVDVQFAGLVDCLFRACLFVVVFEIRPKKATSLLPPDSTARNFNPLGPTDACGLISFVFDTGH